MVVLLSNWFTDSLPVIRDLCQVLFFLVVSAVTILTYMKAKKTLLQPLKTEVFKIQLSEFSRILAMFHGKDEFHLRENIGFRLLLQVNADVMYDEYKHCFFGVKADPAKMARIREICPLTRIIGGVPASSIRVLKRSKIEEDAKPAREAPAPADPAIAWANYRHTIIYVPAACAQTLNALNRLVAAPLMPSECIKKLQSYAEQVDKIPDILADLLTRLAADMPKRYLTLDDLNMSTTEWINHEYVRCCPKLKPHADEILKFVRSYCNVEEIVKT